MIYVYHKPSDNPVGSPSRNEAPHGEPIPLWPHTEVRGGGDRLWPDEAPGHFTLRGPEWDPFKWPEGDFDPEIDIDYRRITLRDPEIEVPVTLRRPDEWPNPPRGPVPVWPHTLREPEGKPIPLGPVKLPGGPVGRPYEGDCKPSCKWVPFPGRPRMYPDDTDGW